MDASIIELPGVPTRKNCKEQALYVWQHWADACRFGRVNDKDMRKKMTCTVAIGGYLIKVPPYKIHPTRSRPWIKLLDDCLSLEARLKHSLLRLSRSFLPSLRAIFEISRGEGVS